MRKAALAAVILASLLFSSLAYSAATDNSGNRQEEEKEQPADQASPSDRNAPADASLSKRNKMKLEQAEAAKKRQELINKEKAADGAMK